MQVQARLEHLPYHIRKLLHSLLSAAFLHPSEPEPRAAGSSGSRGTVFEARDRGWGLLAALQAVADGGGGGTVAMLKLVDEEYRLLEGLASALQNVGLLIYRTNEILQIRKLPKDLQLAAVFFSSGGNVPAD